MFFVEVFVVSLGVDVCGELVCDDGDGEIGVEECGIFDFVNFECELWRNEEKILC